MSTTRPLLGMKRITEVTCTEPPRGRQSPTASRAQSEPLTVDEFTVHEDKQAELRCSKPKVEQVFQVTFTIIGLLDHTGAHGSKASRQIWLQLKGKKEDVSKAKVINVNWKKVLLDNVATCCLTVRRKMYDIYIICNVIAGGNWCQNELSCVWQQHVCLFWHLNKGLW